MADQIEAILLYIEKNGSLDTYEYASAHSLDHQKIIGAVKALQSQFSGYVDVQQYSKKVLLITQEGEQIVSHGSHEVLVFKAIPNAGILQSELMGKFAGETGKVGFSKAMKNGWIEIEKKTEKKVDKAEKPAEEKADKKEKKPAVDPIVRRKVDSINDDVQLILQKVQSLKLDDVQKDAVDDLRKRKLISEIIINGFKVTKGPNFSFNLEKPEKELTADMIADGSWRTKRFKEYNLQALGTVPDSGHLHPLLKVRSEFRKIFIEMGFSEMPTNQYIESSFWNFDSLFQPQQHPARDAHDTFFISNPATAKIDDMEYMKRVKEMHSKGGHGSQGYQYDWKIEEAQKNILRTHTTAVSARMLYKLAKNKPFKPAKYFSIDKVFRNENLDATHLAEFHQIEGLIADRNLTLGDLIGVLYEFFNKLGITKLRFKPAYNPYTEPSMEVFAFHNGLNKWVEIGNSGVFRPEMLLPMGLPSDVSVIAWGLSLERPTMIKYGINNIRDLVGHKVDLDMVAKNPLCRLKK